MTASFEDVLLELVGALERTDIEYVLVGGIAVIAWGDPRTTRDIDVILQVDPDDLPTLEEAVAPRGFSFDVQGARTAIRQGSHFTIFHDDSIFHVDALPASRPGHDRTLDGRERIELHGCTCWIAAPEDTVANKLAFGSEQDFQDAAGILARLGKDLDEDRLERLCGRLGVLDDLRELRSRVENVED